MLATKKTPESIDEYITAFPENVQEKLQLIRKTIKEAAPEAEEAISYQMPTFKYKGNLVYFAAYKNHIGFYPAPRENEAFREELSAYKGAKGTLQIPLDEPVPYDLISRITKFRAAENLQRAASKRKK
jgi:uncharacterized protein YdhG (YjbR/CyaY superfamily)